MYGFTMINRTYRFTMTNGTYGFTMIYSTNRFTINNRTRRITMTNRTYRFTINRTNGFRMINRTNRFTITNIPIYIPYITNIPYIPILSTRNLLFAPTGNYMFKVMRKVKICLKLTIKTSERRH